MDPIAARVFISYRRDDAAGYAGRLEEALERRLGRGGAFRDVQDIPPGEDFVAAIRRRLADAHTVLVLIGPRWAGGETPGRRRIDDERDFVRLEVQVALESGARVVPVLLPGATMPAEDILPGPLKALARRNALPISDTNWDADVDRLVAGFGLPPRRAAWPWAAGGAVLAAAAVAAIGALRFWPAADPGERLIGLWQAELRYDWGDRYGERFEFKRHAGALTGSAGFLGYPRAIEKLQFDGRNLRFETRSEESMGGSTRETTHVYAAELRGKPPNEVLAFRLLTSGGFGSHKAVEFEARRTVAAASGSAPTRP
jgi:hypothetical protein